MDRFCRGCLTKYEEDAQLIQYTEKNRRLFVYSTGIQVKRTDAFTFQLCKDCYLNMKVACKFKKQCRSSEKKFKNFIMLKEAGENIDFTTFLKENDDLLTFRFPMNGYSTPVKENARDDDNESTCTSIQNFMTDILQDEEIPDTEARIIREVIEEEADVLEDSLDSHWLQDDVSIDTDFRLDFSFSPFSTPRSVNNDHRYTPNKINEQKELEDEQQNYMAAKKMLLGVPIKTEKMDLAELDSMKDDSLHKTEIKTVINQCSIDRNLEEALKNKSNNEFSLDDLLLSPLVFSGTTAPATPTITNILFGDKLELNDENSNSTLQKVGQCIEKFEDVKGNIEMVEEFFNKDELDIKIEEEKRKTGENKEREQYIKENIDNAKTEKNSPPSPLENKYCITNFYCKMCNKQFRDLKALKIHFTKYHQIKINGPKNTNNINKHKLRICDYCGRGFQDGRNFFRHLKSHMKPKEEYKCSVCTLEFTSQSKLDMHVSSHTGTFAAKDTGKKFICSICGAISTTISNFRVHQRRHTQNYITHCKECGKGFYRKSDLVIHMRNHTGEKPFPCLRCDRTFARRDCLNKHMRCHIDERPFQCDHCNTRFTKKESLKVHLVKSKTCLKRRNLLMDKDEAVDKQSNNQVNYIYTVQDSVTEFKEPKIIDYEQYVDPT